MFWSYDYDERSQLGDLKYLGVIQFTVDWQVQPDFHGRLATPLWFDEIQDGTATVNTKNPSVTFSDGETFILKGEELRPEIVDHVDVWAATQEVTTEKAIEDLSVLRNFIIAVIKEMK